MAVTDTQSTAGRPNWAIGGLELAAAATAHASAATTTGTSVFAGRGLYWISVVATAIEIASDDEIYGITIEANTAAATTTYEVIGRLTLGCLQKNGIAFDDEAGTYGFAVYNASDYQIRYKLVAAGSIGGTGITCGIHAYPIATING